MMKDYYIGDLDGAATTGQSTTTPSSSASTTKQGFRKSHGFFH